jgi:mRNA-degrading endonuclease RelE of RelBE toxin-antitoxin system
MTVSIFYSDEFKRNVRKLLKKYPSLPKDLDEFIQRLQTGEVSSDLLQHVGLNVYKARIKNSDNRKGKSAGYRIIYYVKKEDEIFLVTLYSKSEQGDISPQSVQKIIDSWHSV